MKPLKLLLFAALLSTAMSSQAQIRYFQNRLSINDALPHEDYELTINKWRGLHWAPKTGVFFTLDVFTAAPAICGHSDQIAFYNPSTTKFNSILVSEVYNLSDKRSKKEITSLSNCMSSIMQLRPVSYKWLDNENIPSVKNSIEGSENENLKTGSSSDNETQFGFLAQEVEEVLPNAVKTLDDGTKLINYSAIIPVLVEAVQSLQATVESQAAVIAQLTDSNKSRSLNSANKIISISPNPTNGYTQINYILASDCTTATIRISNLTGYTVKEVSVRSDETGVNIDCSSLDDGFYVVGLYADNALVATSRMVKE